MKGWNAGERASTERGALPCILQEAFSARGEEIDASSEKGTDLYIKE